MAKRGCFNERLGYNLLFTGRRLGSVVADARVGRHLRIIGYSCKHACYSTPDVAKALKNGDPAPTGLTAVEQAAFKSLNHLYTKGGGYAGMMVTRPHTWLWTF